MRRLTVLAAGALAAVPVVDSLAAQQTQFGGVVGYSVAAAENNTIAGAGRAGLHLRGFVDVPLSPSALSFRGELFYNYLSSGTNTYRVVGSETVPAARSDRTLGITGSFVATLMSRAAISPTFSLGAGLFKSSLTYEPDPMGEGSTRRLGSIGPGVLLGAGLRIRTGGPTLLIDWRYYQGLHATRGSPFMPLSIGVAF